MTVAPASSPEYVALTTRLIELAARFLPVAASSTGTYSSEQYDQVRAYILLCHAEIEMYLEILSESVLQSALTKWELDRLPRTSLISILAFSRGGTDLLPSEVGKAAPVIRSILAECVSDFSRYVRMANHGVKRSDTLRMLISVGIREFEISATWLNTLDAFGATRGSHAHSSAGVTTVVLPDPFLMQGEVNSIVNGLLPIDQRLVQLRAE